MNDIAKFEFNLNEREFIIFSEQSKSILTLIQGFQNQNEKLLVPGDVYYDCCVIWRLEAAWARFQSMGSNWYLAGAAYLWQICEQ